VKQAWTTLELLAVIAIVAILAALSIPVIAAVKNRAYHTTCASNLKQLGTAIHLYAADSDGFVPPAASEENYYMSKGAPPDEVRASPQVLRDALIPFVKSSDVWFCPADADARTDKLWAGQRHLVTSYRFLPMDRELAGAFSWPPRMRLMRPTPDGIDPRADVPLISDPAGFWKLDRELPESEHAVTIHPDQMVNIVSHDLSLSRMSADEFSGVR
jgi:type II secretory pathway pseudopilin PulG